ncbi:hypothetical protein D3C77_563200 [compost metagenome]
MLTQFVMAQGIFLHKLLVHQAAVEQDMHQAERQSRVRSWMERNEPVRPVAGPIPVHINNDQLRPLFARLLHNGPGVHIRADRVLSPYDEQLGLGGLFRACSAHESHRILPACVASGIADALVQPG